MPANRRTTSSVGSGSGNGDGSASQSARKPYAKVNRSLRACDACHARKTRCSGQIPCKFCISRGIDCVMSDDSIRSHVPRAGTSRSQERAALQYSIEQRHSQTSLSPHAGALAPPNLNGTPFSHFSASQSSQSASAAFHHATQARASNHSGSAYYTHEAPGGNATPSRDLSTSPGKGDRLQPLQIAPSRSPHSATHRISRSPRQQQAYEHQTQFDGFIFTRFHGPQRSFNEGDITLLLTREKSNRYLDLYFSEAECIYQLWPVPFIIQHCHDVIWGETPEAERYGITSLPQGLRSTLTALLAFGALLDRNINDSETLYHAARSNYLDITDAATLESVHLALQLAVFEINTRRAVSGWNSLAVAIRTAQYLNLHRKSALKNHPQEEALRRSQLWHSCFIQDCWMSMATGKPPLICEGDSDLDKPLDDSDAQQAPTFVSPFLPLLVRLSSIWCDVYAKLFRIRPAGVAEPLWNEALPSIDTELRVWQRDIHQLYARLSTSLNRSERLHCQAVLLTFSSIRLTIHRAYLGRYCHDEQQQHNMLQRVMSQNTILDSAADVAAYTKASLQLGMRQCFAFLGTSLYIAYLSIWEYLHNKHSAGRTDDPSRAGQGMDNMMWLIEHISQSGENPSMQEVLSAVRALQQTPGNTKVEEASLPTPVPIQPYKARSISAGGYFNETGHSSLQSSREPFDNSSQHFSHPERQAGQNYASTSAQPYAPRTIDARAYSQSSWPTSLPFERSYGGPSKYNN